MVTRIVILILLAVLLARLSYAVQCPPGQVVNAINPQLCTPAAAGPTGPTGVPGSTYSLPNDMTNGTITNRLVKLTNAAPSTVIITSAGDTHGAIGICVTNCGLTGNATIAISGSIGCIFDGSTTAGDYVQQSATGGGACTDAGSSVPASGQIIGRVIASGGIGLKGVLLFAPP